MNDLSSVLTHPSRKSGLHPGAVAWRIVLAWSIISLVRIGPLFGAPMQTTVRDCAEIVRDFTRIPEHAIPPHVLRNAKGVAILRVLKGGFIVSGRAGEGVVVARLPGGGWAGLRQWCTPSRGAMITQPQSQPVEVGRAISVEVRRAELVKLPSEDERIHNP